MNRPNDRRGQSELYDDMRLYGIDAFEFDILEECPEEKLVEREEYYIALYNTAEMGYNICETSYAMSDPKVADAYYTEEKRKEYAKRMKQANRKSWQDPEYREQKSKAISDLQKQRLQDPEYRKEKSEQLRRYWESIKRKVAQYTLDGELVKIYDGIRVAERDTGISTIHKHIRNPDKRKQAGGYIWKYVD